MRHAFSTRVAEPGGGDFDLGGADTTPEIEDRRRRLVRAAGLPASLPLAPRQVHGCRLVCIDADGGEEAARGTPPEADGEILLAPPAPQRVGAVRTADCVPLLLADGDGRAAGALHAGWRGIAAGIVGTAVSALATRGFEASTLRVVLGPAIGPCCYEVGEDVRGEIGRSLGDDAVAAFVERAGARPRLDLHRALRLQLERAGVRPELVSAAPWCTACREDLFFSHRRDAGRSGRMMALIGLSSSVA